MLSRGKVLSLLALVLGIAAAATAVLHSRRPKVGLDEELRRVATQFKDRDRRDGDAILAELQGTYIGADQIPQISYAVARAVTLEVPADKSGDRGAREFADLAMLEPDLDDIARVRLGAWARHAGTNRTVEYILRLASQDYGSTRQVLRYLLNGKENIPYLELLVAQAAKSLYDFDLPFVNRPESLSEGSKECIRRLFKDEALIRWSESRITSLKQYAGMTNTVIGIYDWLSYPEFRQATGFEDFPHDADGRFDLGGGFATPDISRMIGQPFVSLDLIPPQEAKSWDLHFYVLQRWRTPSMVVADARLQTPEERKQYLALLDAQAWQHLDVFEDSLPANYNSYFITSFGFLSSTVGSLSDSPNNRIEELLNCYRTTYMSVRRVIELVALGKEVSLFTYQRATRKYYRYRTVLLKFKDHRLTEFKLWPGSTHVPGGALERLAADQR